MAADSLLLLNIWPSECKQLFTSTCILFFQEIYIYTIIFIIYITSFILLINLLYTSLIISIHYKHYKQ